MPRRVTRPPTAAEDGAPWEECADLCLTVVQAGFDSYPIADGRQRTGAFLSQAAGRLGTQLSAGRHHAEHPALSLDDTRRLATGRVGRGKRGLEMLVPAVRAKQIHQRTTLRASMIRSRRLSSRLAAWLRDST